MISDRDRLVALAERLIAGDYQSDAELDSDLAEFDSAVPHPRATDLIYYWENEFDHEPSPDEVVDRALKYRAIEL